MRTRTLTRQDKRAKRSLHNSEGNPHNSPQTITPSSPHPASGSPQAPSTSTFHQTLQDPAYTSPNQDTTPEPPPKAPDGEQDEEELDEEEDARLEKSFGFRPAPQFEPTNVPKLKDTRNLATRFGSVVREGEEWKC
ncbi:MAG: hypothetical protein M1836_005088 [Candelina mexicana]|nr:MAG: hypothetical protein M1836_005088 [Candelina mexicana]